MTKTIEKPTATNETTNITMTPQEIVSALDNFIIGQDDAKRAVAIALRNRWRRMQLPEELRKEITPKNILMIGPTGVGKTEISRRLSHLANAPFIKVEATKFTEVGYVGRDVESIIRDLVDVSIKQAKEAAIKQVEICAKEAAEQRILNILVPQSSANHSSQAGFIDEPSDTPETTELVEETDSATRQLFRKKLQSGEIDDREIEIETSATNANVEIMGPPGMEEMVGQLQNMMESMSNKKKRKRRLPIGEARQILIDEEAAKLVEDDQDNIQKSALNNVEQNGIVFIDEIDKIVKRSDTMGGGDVSREGVQRDLLPLVEGCTVTTKHGMIKTDHILFIASGAFHLAKPSDLVPELQGRFPIRVELKALTTEDFERILVEPNASLTEQYAALMSTEQINLSFEKCGIKRLAEIAFQVNNRSENIGARRLHTILERLLEKLSFEATERPGENISITAAYVDEQLSKLADDEDLSRYIL